jgi:hypothetical protein
MNKLQPSDSSDSDSNDQVNKTAQLQAFARHFQFRKQSSEELEQSESSTVIDTKQSTSRNKL